MSGRTTRGGWMRVEGQGHRRPAPLVGAAAHAVDDLHVTAMESVEVTERQHRLVPASRARVLRKMNNVHVSSKLSGISGQPFHAFRFQL